MYNIFELQEKPLEDLKLIATELGIDDENRDRTQLIYDIIDHQVDHPDIKKTQKNKKQKQTKNDAEAKAKPAKAPVEKKEIKEIRCNVSKCAYNKDQCKCMAGQIEVGTDSACTKEETRCAEETERTEETRRTEQAEQQRTNQTIREGDPIYEYQDFNGGIPGHVPALRLQRPESE